jgi:hypoxanthine phosphoribosyltransferase
MIAIARGGVVPARLVCDYLDTYDLATIRIEHYKAGANKAQQARLAIPLSIDIRDSRILLVDDVSDTGDTLLVARDYLFESGASEVKIAALHHKTVSTLVPDYYSEKITDWYWIVYPWAIMEDVKGFIQTMDPAPENQREIVERLKKDYDLEINQALLDDLAEFGSLPHFR